MYPVTISIRKLETGICGKPDPDCKAVATRKISLLDTEAYSCDEHLDDLVAKAIWAIEKASEQIGEEE